MKLEITGIEGLRRELKNSLSQTLEDLADEVLLDARSNTPVRTGNAKRSWEKRVDKKNFQVENRVPYIERLEAGASRQAPKGIIGPTLAQVKGKI
jgi:hypothetical protein